MSLADVTKSFGGLTAVSGVSFSVGAGERRAIIGPNGAGKTTLFSLISGEQLPTSGQIQLFGRDITRLAPHRRAALGLTRTYQITNLFPRLSVMENCLLAVQGLRPMKFHLHRDLRRYPEVMEVTRSMLGAVGLLDKAGATVRDLSHGEQRQLEIALALAGSPKLLLLDEPTAGLSPAESAMMTALLKQLDPSITAARHRARHGRRLPAHGSHHRAPLRPGGGRRDARRGHREPARAGDLPGGLLMLDARVIDGGAS